MWKVNISDILDKTCVKTNLETEVCDIDAWLGDVTGKCSQISAVRTVENAVSGCELDENIMEMEENSLLRENSCEMMMHKSQQTTQVVTETPVRGTPRYVHCSKSLSHQVSTARSPPAEGITVIEPITVVNVDSNQTPQAAQFIEGKINTSGGVNNPVITSKNAVNVCDAINEAYLEVDVKTENTAEDSVPVLAEIKLEELSDDSPPSADISQSGALFEDVTRMRLPHQVCEPTVRKKTVEEEIIQPSTVINIVTRPTTRRQAEFILEEVKTGPSDKDRSSVHTVL